MRWFIAFGFLALSLVACGSAREAAAPTPVVGTQIIKETKAASVVDRQRSKLSELEQAKARWETRPFSSYRLLIQLQPHGGSACETAFEVNEPAQTKTLSDTCSALYDSYLLKSLGSRTSVPGLFDYIAAEIGRMGECGPNGCACDGGRTIDVVYDTDFGYPKRVEERLEWFEKAWPTKEPAQPCSAMGPSLPSPFTVSVNPIK
jgi:Family of unknown function (DUF6174)